ncbi:PucR family transcriptional regulator [Sphaerisporangium viridialbum]|uniref:PucR family transcriptional regulator n=1 Tax=Sphaerisporangium viridialbum TaxID=46189 RepID=UPI003C74A4C6
MASGLQRVVDGLAVQLGRAVMLEDRLQHVLAYSRQKEPLDDIRRDSILRRETTPEVREWLRAAGIFDAQGPIRTPGADALGLLPRVCVPARHGGRLLGFLWFIDAGPPMSEEEIGVVAEVASAVGVALFHESLAIGLAAHRELDAVTSVLLGTQGAAEEGARSLIEAGSFPQSEPVTVAVARPLLDGQVDEPLREAMERALLTVRHRLGPRRTLHLVRYDHAVLIFSGAARPEQIHAAMEFPVVVGTGEPRPRLDQASGSYVEAARAAEVAARMPALGPSAEWSRLGVYRLLTQLPPTTLKLHEGLERLLADETHRPLLEALEVYLDLAGSAHAASERLRLHRTSLYYRLRRVEELAGTDLRDGGERLTLHLSLKLARLLGRYPRAHGRGTAT